MACDDIVDMIILLGDSAGRCLYSWGFDSHDIRALENALPLIVTYGWPGSIIEQLKIIDPLTNPTAHGASASDAFDIVVGKPLTTGWDISHIVRAWTTLMKRLGYTRFVAAGGNVGAQVVDEFGVQAPPELLAFTRTCRGPFRPTLPGHSPGTNRRRPVS